MTTPPPAPDWYPDPSGKPGMMYWDGRQWHPGPDADAPPPAEETPPQPAPTTARTHPVLIAAIVAAVVILVGLAGVTGYLLLQHQHPAQTPTAQPASPSPAMVPSATAAPSATTPDWTPFLGHWSGGHSGALDIRSDGTGRWTYDDRSTCPDSGLAGCGIAATVDFRLTSLANGTATGSATAVSNPKNDSVGEPVQIVLGTGLQGRGVVLAVSISKMQGWSFCNQTSPHYCAEG